MTDQGDEWLSVKKAAKRAGVHYNTLIKRIRTGEIKSSRPTWRIKVHRDEIDAWMRREFKPRTV